MEETCDQLREELHRQADVMWQHNIPVIPPPEPQVIYADEDSEEEDPEEEIESEEDDAAEANGSGMESGPDE